MSPDASIVVISTGTELASGRSRDANGPFLARSLTAAGYRIYCLATIADSPEILLRELRRFMEEDSVAGIIMTGGMGPTEDDHTVDVLSRLLSRPVQEDHYHLNLLINKLEGLGDRLRLDYTRRQTRVIEGCTVLKNETGIAPGILADAVKSDGRPVWIAAMSGFPQEMNPIFEHSLLPEIKKRMPPHNLKRIDFYIYGTAESKFQNDFFNEKNLSLKLPSDFSWGVSAGRGQLKIFIESSDEQALGQIYQRAKEQYTAVFSDKPAEEEIHEFCIRNNIRIGLAESCTGGLIGKTLTDAAGSSAYFNGSLVTYANEAKVNILGVPESLLITHGAVSAPAAEAMAKGALEALEADYALSVTGVAGPGGGSPEKPVGLVWAGLASRKGTVKSERLFFPLDRERIREFTTGYALFLLYDFIRTEHNK